MSAGWIALLVVLGLGGLLSYVLVTIGTGPGLWDR